jgi:hypothetical protein
MEVFDILEDLASNPSRNYKIQKLQENEDNALLRWTVFLALDPFTQFYIRKIPKYTAAGNGDLMNALNSLHTLSSREKTGHAGIEHLTEVLSSLSPKNANVVEKIIAKDLKCGVSVATANEVWMGLIKEYPTMLCSGYEEKLVDKINWPAFVQLKCDGMRFNAVITNGKCEFKSRNGKTVDLLGNLENEFVQASNGIDCMFDGELLVVDGVKVLDRQTGNGILNKAVKGTISEKEAAMVVAVVWDYIPYMYFLSSYCPMPYEDRFKNVNKLLANKYDRIRIVDSMLADNYEEAKSVFEKFLEEGQEGIILKDRHGEWEDKRVKHQIKFKGELECDLKVVGFEEGTGKYAGKLGALICESEDGIIKVKVGSGFNDEDRESIKAQSVIGKLVAVKYNARIRSKSHDESLFLPIFLEIREDKTQADSSGSIK